MKFPNFSFTLEWNELKKFDKLDISGKKIIFYAENSSSFNHFRLLIDELTNKLNIPICYVTSIKNDKIFQINNSKITSFYIGDGAARTKFFLTLKACVLIMDMPDLERFHIKKSKVYSVCYVYLFHSMFSIHTYLRKGALDDFDVIFCVGPHHIKEIKEIENIYNLKQKKLVNYGFGRLDSLLQEKKNYVDKKEKNLVIIAPTYGKNNLLNICGMELISILLDANFQVILRPHYRILNDSKKLISNIKEKFSQNENFTLETGILNPDDFHLSICMITDWSGIGIEYALTRENRVIFIDLPQKIMNAEFDQIHIDPMEQSIRNKIGHLVSPTNLKSIPKLIQDENNISDIDVIRSSIVFNIHESAQVGSIVLKEILMAQKCN
tara:strand:+ start:936 stop:2078 length:1143 start_codon:yes stop_codon:yes gene_type:complete